MNTENVDLNKKDRELADANPDATIEQLVALGLSEAGEKKLRKASEESEHSTHKVYDMYTVEVESVIGKGASGAKQLKHHEGRIVEKARKKGLVSTGIRMEPFRIARMNSKWHTTKQYFVEQGARVPDTIIRTPNGDTEVNGGWDDKIMYND